MEKFKVSLNDILFCGYKTICKIIEVPWNRHSHEQSHLFTQSYSMMHHLLGSIKPHARRWCSAKLD